VRHTRLPVRQPSQQPTNSFQLVGVHGQGHECGMVRRALRQQPDEHPMGGAVCLQHHHRSSTVGVYTLPQQQQRGCCVERTVHGQLSTGAFTGPGTACQCVQHYHW
jgi:hypothetical protein